MKWSKLPLETDKLVWRDGAWRPKIPDVFRSDQKDGSFVAVMANQSAAQADIEVVW